MQDQDTTNPELLRCADCNVVLTTANAGTMDGEGACALPADADGALRCNNHGDPGREAHAMVGPETFQAFLAANPLAAAALGFGALGETPQAAITNAVPPGSSYQCRVCNVALATATDDPICRVCVDLGL